MSVEQSNPGDVVQIRAEPDLADTVETIDTDTGPRLAGSQCTACAELAYPPLAYCVECGHATTRTALADQGRLYAYTTVWVSSAAETPYTIGFVDLDDDVRVLSRIGDPHLATVDGRVAIEVSADGTYLARPVPEKGDS